jgi:peptide/nickel transport system substrate-binding protein
MLDPCIGTDDTGSTVAVNLYDPLIKLGVNGTVLPWIATSWVTSPNGLVWTFTLKKGVKFHDGTELEAKDVAYSINRHLLMGQGRAYVLDAHLYKNATVVEGDKVRVWLKHQYGPFLAALNGWYILNADLLTQHYVAGEYGENKDFGKLWLLTHDVGSGAYKVKYIFLEEKLVMEKFDAYHAGFAANAPEIVEIICGCEPITVRLSMANRQQEATDPYQPYDNLLSIKTIPNVYIAAFVAITGNYQLMLNTKKPPMDDVHFRKFLAYSMDYNTVTNTLFPGTVQCQGPINQAMAGFDPNTYKYTYDPVKAAQELALSKYASNITKYTLDLYWSADVPDQEKVCLMLMAEVAKYGVKINALRTPWTKVVHDVATQETSPHMAYIGAGGAFPEAGSYFATRYSSVTTGTWTQVEWLLNTTLDAQINDALATVDYNSRMAKYKLITRDIVNMCPTIWLYAACSYYGLQDYVVPDWTKNKVVGTSALGKIYLPTAQAGGYAEYRLWQVNKSIPYQ